VAHVQVAVTGLDPVGTVTAVPAGPFRGS